MYVCIYYLYISTELPVGWEEAEDPILGRYFIDHNTSMPECPFLPIIQSFIEFMTIGF